MSATLTSLLARQVSAGLFQWEGSHAIDIAQQGRDADWLVKELDTRQVRDSAQLYDHLATAWELPSWFGRNLDAFWDVLGELAASPLLVVWEGYSNLADVDPELAQTVLELLRDASTQSVALAVIVLDAPALIDLDALL